MLLITITQGILLFVSFLLIMIFLILGKYDTEEVPNEIVVEEKPDSIRIHKSASMELWLAIVRASKGEIIYIPVVLLFFLIHSFSLTLLLQAFLNSDIDENTRYVFYFMFIALPLSFINQIRKSYARQK